MHIKVEFDFGSRKSSYDAECVQIFPHGVAPDDFIWLGEKLEDLAKSFFSVSYKVLASAEETISDVNNEL